MNPRLYLIAYAHYKNFTPADMTDEMEVDTQDPRWLDSYEWAKRNENDFITVMDADYPRQLHALPSAPRVVHKSTLAVVDAIQEKIDAEIKELFGTLVDKMKEAAESEDDEDADPFGFKRDDGAMC